MELNRNDENSGLRHRRARCVRHRRGAVFLHSSLFRRDGEPGMVFRRRSSSPPGYVRPGRMRRTVRIPDGNRELGAYCRPGPSRERRIRSAVRCIGSGAGCLRGLLARFHRNFRPGGGCLSPGFGPTFAHPERGTLQNMPQRSGWWPTRSRW